MAVLPSTLSGEALRLTEADHRMLHLSQRGCVLVGVQAISTNEAATMNVGDIVIGEPRPIRFAREDYRNPNE